MSPLTGRTITVEEIGKVPELARAPRGSEGELRIVERSDGMFVCAHAGARNLNPIWDNARHLAARLDARYVGPGREEFAPVAEIGEGWHVQLGSRGRQSWQKVTQVTALVDLHTQQPRARLRVEFDRHPPITVAACARLHCRPLTGS